MPITFNLKRSSTASSVPAALATGEPAVNLTDNRLFFGTGSSVQEFLPDINRLPGTETTALSNVRPSLSLNFLDRYSIDPRVVCSRYSTATFIDQNGVMQTAAARRPRIDHDPVTKACRGLLVEEIRTNLLQYSSNFSASAWGVAGAQTSTSSMLSPTGTVTATILTEDTSNGFHSIMQSVGSITTNVTYTFSFYAKYISRQYIAAEGLGFNAQGYFAVFDLINGVVSTNTGNFGKIVPAGNGWYRCSIFVTASNTTPPAIQLCNNSSGNTSYIGDGTSSVYIWGAQLELGAFPTSYIPSNDTFTSRSSTATYFDSTGTLQTASSNVARYDYGYVNNQWVSKGLLLENQATNLFLYSDQFNNAAWVKGNLSVTANATAAPDGLVTADKVIPNTTANLHSVAKTISSSAGFVCFSVFCKAAEYSNIRLQINPGAGGGYADFDSSNGTITGVNLQNGFTGNLSAKSDSFGNGWYRFQVSGQLSATSSTTYALYISGASGVSSAGDGTSGLYIWGAQLETNSYATSYIPTTSAQVTRSADVSISSQVTRAADVVNVPVTSPWMRTDEFSLVASAMAIASNNTKRYHICGVDDGTVNNRAYMRVVSGRAQQVVVTNGVTNVVSDLGTAPQQSEFRIAGAFKQDNCSGIVTGGNIVSDTSVTIPFTTQMQIGSSAGGFDFLNGWVRYVGFYPKRLSDSEITNFTK